MFRTEKKLTSKGKLATILYVTRQAKRAGLPMDPDSLVTANRGQVQGLGKTAVQSILLEYGITRVLAQEAGRTSRGSLGYMYEYISLLNEFHSRGLVDLEIVERWWIDKIHNFFSAQPFSLKYDRGKSLRSVVRDLLVQAYKRQNENPGTMYAGAVLQHLVGAKLSLVLPNREVINHGFSVADDVSGRSGDFIIDEVIIHVTTAPSEALMQKCIDNLNAGHQPIIVTTHKSMPAAEALAGIHEIEGRVDILEAEQFIATNLYELSRFQTSERKLTIERLIEKYNEIVESCETDPSLKVSIG